MQLTEAHYKIITIQPCHRMFFFFHWLNIVFFFSLYYFNASKVQGPSHAVVFHIRKLQSSYSKHQIGFFGLFTWHMNLVKKIGGEEREEGWGNEFAIQAYSSFNGKRKNRKKDSVHFCFSEFPYIRCLLSNLFQCRQWII